MAIVKPFCPKNGCGGTPNGAAMPQPSHDACKTCGYPPGQRGDGLSNWDRYCPQCFHCVSCNRIIKRKATGLK